MKSNHSLFPISSPKRRRWRERTSVLEHTKPFPQGSKRVDVISLRTEVKGPQLTPASEGFALIPSYVPLHHPLTQVARNRYAASSHCAKVCILNICTDPNFLPQNNTFSSSNRSTQRIRTFYAFYKKPRRRPAEEWIWELDICEGPDFVLFGICFWENMFLSSHNVRTDRITINSQGVAVSVALAC